MLDKGKVYIELDAAFKVDQRDQFGRFSSFVPRVVVGAGGRVEVGVNVIGNTQPGSDATTIVPTVKWKFYENEKKDVALFAGTNFYIPARNRSYNFGTYSYAAVAKTINKTRLTAGGYVASKNVFAANAVRAGGQFGVEQTLNSKVSLAADWVTGKHSSAYFTPGVIYKPHPKVTTYWSYSIGIPARRTETITSFLRWATTSTDTYVGPYLFGGDSRALRSCDRLSEFLFAVEKGA